MRHKRQTAYTHSTCSSRLGVPIKESICMHKPSHLCITSSLVSVVNNGRSHRIRDSRSPCPDLILIQIICDHSCASRERDPTCTDIDFGRNYLSRNGNRGRRACQCQGVGANRCTNCVGAGGKIKVAGCFKPSLLDITVVETECAHGL